MTNKRTTKQALVASAILLCMTFTMLLGTTFAWFTDSATSAGNIIKAGTLNVEMYYADGTEDPANANWNDASRGSIFNYENWEPGYVAARQIKISNEGTLDLKYKLNIVANGEVTELADVIDVYFIDPALQLTDRTAIPADAKIGTLTQVLAGLENGTLGANTLGAGKSVSVTIALKMQESAGNEYQNLGIGSSFSIQLLATQVASEEDSFNNQYDNDATYPSVANGTVENAGEELELSMNNIKVTIPGSATEEGDSYEIVVSNENVVTDAETGETTVDFDLTLYKNNAKVDGNTVYAVEIPVGNAYITNVTHNGVALTEATSGADQTYKYANGVLTIYTKSFSPFSLSYLEADELVADKEGEQAYSLTFEEFRASVNNGNDFSGWTITLMNNIDFEGSEFTPIGIATGSGTSIEGCAPFSGMFDGNGHTLSNYKVAGGITVDGDPWLSLFALIYAKDGNTAGVKNLTIDKAAYNNANGTVGVIANLANSDGKSAIEFSNINVNATINAFGYYGQAGLVTLMYGSENTVKNVDIDVDFIIPADFTVAGYKFISPCFGQLSMIQNGHITFDNVDYSDCDFYYPNTFKLEDRSTVIAGYNAIWVYNTLAGTRVLGCGGYSGQFYDRGVTFTIDGVDYAHADLLKEQKDSPGYMYDYIIRPTKFVAYTSVSTADELKAAITNANDGDVILIANDITVTDNWDARYGGKTAKNITIDGLGNTLKFTNEVHDGGNNHSVFRFEGDATVKNLTFDMSEVVKNKAGRMRAISAAGNLTVDNCTFIGNAAYGTDEAISIGEGHSADQTAVNVTVTNSTFSGPWRRAISDNESGKREIKSYVISGNTFDNNIVNVSAYESILFTDNTVIGVSENYIKLVSYTNKDGLKVVESGNTYN